MGVNGMSNVGLFGVIPDGTQPDASSGMTDEQALKRLSAGGGRDGRSMAGPVPGGSNRTSFDPSYGGGGGMPGTGSGL